MVPLRHVRTPRAIQRSIDELASHVAVLDGDGAIVAVNEAWRRFGRENGLAGGTESVGVSYLRVCESPPARATEGPEVARAIRRILGGDERPLRKGYSCHGPGRAAWFQVEVASLHHGGRRGALVTHTPVSEAAILREVADAERRRIARELHDTTAQNLAAALLDLERVAGAQRESSGSVSRDLAEAIELCRRSLDDVRGLSYELGPPGFSAGSLVASLQRLVGSFARRSGLAVMLFAAPLSIGDDDLTLESAQTLYRTAEESLQNAQRHSGGHHVSIRLERGTSDLRLEVADDGRGIAPDAPAGKGLDDVKDRLEACGGRLELSGAPGGTVLVASVPVGGRRDALDRHHR